MARALSAKYSQLLVDEWRSKLLAIGLMDRAKPSNLRRLADLLYIDLSRVSPATRRSLQEALKQLIAALVVARSSGGAAVRPDELDAWIEQRLVKRGSDLLIPDDQRRAALARHRDGKRRYGHALAGLRSARIEMHEDAWAELTKIRTHHGTATIGQTLALIINAHFRSMKNSKAKGGRLKTSTEEASLAKGDLFSTTAPTAKAGLKERPG